MIYICDKCNFIFERTGLVDACPDCGKPAVREADEQEQKEYVKIRSEIHSDRHIKRP